jgi:glucosamine--fructose-6-phosphate aminotransferase (isomerizing)
MTKMTHTWKEIVSQPKVWQDTLASLDHGRPTLERFLQRAAFERILVVGCGSSYYLAQAAAANLARHAGLPAQACPSSELWLFPNVMPARPTLLVAVSRSGTTTETLLALESFRREKRGPALAVTCDRESRLAQVADLTLAAAAAQERSVAQTRSFTSMLLLTQALTAALANDAGMWETLQRLPGCLSSLEHRLGELPQRLGADTGITDIFYLGAGPLYGIACEAMLKTKEMSLTVTEAYHTLEFRHGPMSMVTERSLVVALVSDSGQTEELRALADMQKLGARVLALVENAAACAGWQPDYLIELRSGLVEWARQPLYLPPLQRLAYHRALAKGLDPDRPHNLTAVVEL